MVQIHIAQGSVVVWWKLELWEKFCPGDAFSADRHTSTKAGCKWRKTMLNFFSSHPMIFW